MPMNEEPPAPSFATTLSVARETKLNRYFFKSSAMDSFSDNQSGDISFEQLKELDALFDKQLKGTQQEAKSGRAKPFSLKKALGWAAALLVLSVLPFFVLIRSSLFLYERYAMNGWLALGIGVGVTILLLLLYAAVVSYRFQQTARVHKYVRRGIMVLVLAYCGYGLLYFSGLNAKSAEVESYYLSLHPILRVTMATTILINDDLVVTDMQRRPEDYEAMGLPVRQESLHYVQETGYVHAVDIRTRNRPEWKNWLTRGSFAILGMNTLRHVGTADHLHISLPVHK